MTLDELTEAIKNCPPLTPEEHRKAFKDFLVEDAKWQKIWAQQRKDMMVSDEIWNRQFDI